MTHPKSVLIQGISELVTNDPAAGPGLIGRVRGASVILDDGLIGWVGPASSAPAADSTVDAGGPGGAARAGSTRTPTWCSPATGPPSSPPGWPESLTAQGESSRRWRRPGPRTIRTLLAIARRHRAEMIAGGTTYMETKTGYGLTVADEIRSARTPQAAGFDEITFLGAHVVPA